MKRFLDCNASDFRAMSGRDLLESIRLSEGRVIAAEVIAMAAPLMDKVSNVELAAAMGADLILINFYDVTRPRIAGFAVKDEAAGFTLADFKAMVGRPVGLNLEPIENPAAITTTGRLATGENARLAVAQGADFIVITGNPATGVTAGGIARSVADIRRTVGGDVPLLAGKMHAAGSTEPVVTTEDVATFAAAGADGLLFPTPGTVPGITVEVGHALVELAHARGLIAMNAIGTSQEGANIAVIEQLALASKMTGADVHHIGDSGYIGIAVPENITAFSIAIRGRRHTWHRMATSLRR